MKIRRTAIFFLCSKPISAENIAPPVTKKVMVINFNPVIESQNKKTLIEFYNWSNPQRLANQYITDVKQVSGNYVNYEIAEWHEVDDFPVKQNGFDFTDDSYLQCMQNQNCDRTMANYRKILADFQVCEKRNNETIHELWVWGGPWFGFWEAVMAGPNAFNTNGPPITNTTCQKQLHIMGFSYERGVPEMLEDLGHRIEGTLSYVFGEDSRWNCNGYDYIKWWLSHLPKVLGQTDGKWNNWWRYILDYEEASQSLEGDLNQDGKVDIFDYNILVGNFGR